MLYKNKNSSCPLELESFKDARSKTGLFILISDLYERFLNPCMGGLFLLGILLHVPLVKWNVQFTSCIHYIIKSTLVFSWNWSHRKRNTIAFHWSISSIWVLRSLVLILKFQVHSPIGLWRNQWLVATVFSVTLKESESIVKLLTHSSFRTWRWGMV